MRVPHESALVDEAIAHFAAEAKGKVALNQARLLLYEEIKGNISAQMKVSPIYEIPTSPKHSYRCWIYHFC